MNNKLVRISTLLAITVILSSIALQPTVLANHAFPSNAPQAQPNVATVNGDLTTTSLHDAGATFPAPLIFQWASQFHAQFPNDTLYYRSVGSGAGIASLINKTGDFAQSDAPLNAAQRILAPNVLHIPDTIGSVVPAYNLKANGILTGLNFTGDVLARIYLGNITVWNDARIQSLNPGVVLPANPITTVHRSDGSGTTFVWTSYLSLSNPTWASTVGKGTTVVWPNGVAAAGNPGVANYVNNTANTIGYVELNYALSGGHNTFGAVRNGDNTAYVLASLQTTQNAVASVSGLPAGNGDWSGVSMLNEPGLQTYPIASFTYALVYKELNVLPSMNINETSQAHELKRLLNWIISPTGGQSYSSALYYVPLPANVMAIDQASINSITYTVVDPPSTYSIALTGNAVSGWNGSIPGPTINVVSGDTINFAFTSGDAATHQWYIDFDGNSALDPIESGTAGPTFSSTASFSFTPAIGLNVPTAGNFTYRCSVHPGMTGIINIRRQQTAANLLIPSTLTSSLTSVIDTSRVTTIGSALIDTRTSAITGNITLAAVNSVSGAVTLLKSFLIPALKISGGFRYIVFCTPTLPYAISSQLSINGPGAGLSYSAKQLTLSRCLDPAGDGTVDIVDVATAAIAYGTISTDARYNPKADFDANGDVNIFDISLIAFYYGATALH